MYLFHGDYLFHKLGSVKWWFDVLGMECGALQEHVAWSMLVEAICSLSEKELLDMLLSKIDGACLMQHEYDELRSHYVSRVVQHTLRAHSVPIELGGVIESYCGTTYSFMTGYSLFREGKTVASHQLIASSPECSALRNLPEVWIIAAVAHEVATQFADLKAGGVVGKTEFMRLETNCRNLVKRFPRGPKPKWICYTRRGEEKVFAERIVGAALSQKKRTESHRFNS